MLGYDDGFGDDGNGYWSSCGTHAVSLMLGYRTAGLG
jgi:hypothetical protein